VRKIRAAEIGPIAAGPIVINTPIAPSSAEQEN